MFIQQQIDHLIQVNAGGDGWDAGRWEIQLKHYQKCNAIITCKFKQYYAKTFLATYRIQGTIWGRFFEWSATKVHPFFQRFLLKIIEKFQTMFLRTLLSKVWPTESKPKVFVLSWSVSEAENSEILVTESKKDPSNSGG